MHQPTNPEFSPEPASPNAHDSPLPVPPEDVGQPIALGSVVVPSRFFLAPLAGYTSLAYRLVVRSLGGLGLATTDLVNARSLLENRSKAFELAETCPEDQPMAIQIYGAKRDEMAEAARRVVALGASVVDINMGCPVNKVVKSGGGSALMCQTDAAVTVVESVVEAAGVPVTVKMRLGWDDDNLTAPLLARAFEQVGVAAVIIHGRTRAQGFRGLVNRDGIRQVVEAVERIPIVANGDILTIADAARMFEETGCAAVSIGRGALANPYFFQQLTRWARTGDPGPAPSFDERVTVMDRHFHALLERRGEYLACLQFRKLIKWYCHWFRPPKPLYHRLINIHSAARFEESVAMIREAGPVVPLATLASDSPRIAVPSGPVDKW